MSVILNALENRAENRKEEIRVVAPPSESLISVKIGLAFSFFVTFISLVSVIYFFQALNGEKKDREVFESGYAQFQEKAQMLEYELKKIQTETDELRGEIKTYTEEKAELLKKVEENQLAIAGLQAQAQALEASSQVPPKETEKLPSVSRDEDL